MGELKYFLGLQIHQTKEGALKNQEKYCKKLLKRFDMEKSKVITISMSSSCNLKEDKNGNPIEERKYRCMIGYLLYLTTSHANTMFVVCMCVFFQSSPKESHLAVVKRIMRYLFGTKKMSFDTPREQFVT